MNPVIKALNFIRSYTMRPPKWLTVSIVLIPFALSGYWAITQSGWYLRVSVWQADFSNGDFYPALSFLLPVLFMLIFLIPVMMLVGMFFPEKHPDETNMKKGLF
jgi:hypothetical protein